MRRWQPSSGQCIFCAFRKPPKSKTRTHRHCGRGVATTPALQRERVLRSRAGGVARPDDYKRTRHSDASSDGHKKNTLFDYPYNKRVISNALNEETEEKSDREYLSSRSANINRLIFDPTAVIKSVTDRLRGRISGKDKSSDVEDAYLKSLDPHLRHWRKFEEKLEAVFSGQAGVDSEYSEQNLKELKDRLFGSLKTSGPSGLEKCLEFAFLDHVLAGQTRDTAGKLRKFADLRYPTEWYAVARQMQRAIHLHIGPTNSGKTYNALKRLEEAGNGFYAGPLRLLAHEVYSRFLAKGIACNLVTGDDIRLDESGAAKLVSSTVEMVNTVKVVDVAVIDEIQMMAEENRGWAWTRAFLGANAKEVHLCGEPRVVPLIRELAASMGDKLHVHEYERLNSLRAMPRSLRGNLRNLRKGDCIVCFSVVQIHAMKKQIELDTGRRVAIVYGSLPPETRAHQAELFNEPDNEYDILVASDAIGMGLNLSIKRIIFESVWKKIGPDRVRLTIPEVKQIAGRAGRFRSASQAMKGDKAKETGDSARGRGGPDKAFPSIGLVTCLDEDDLPYITSALEAEPEPIKQAAILPPTELIEDFAAQLPPNIPFDYILQRLTQVAVLHPRYKMCMIGDQMAVARTIEPVGGLTIRDRCTFGTAPGFSVNKVHVLQRVMKALAETVADGTPITVVDLVEMPLELLDRQGNVEIRELELLHKSLVLYLWLSYRFPLVLKDRPMAMYAKTMVEEKIKVTLSQRPANPKLRDRLFELKKKPVSRIKIRFTESDDTNELSTQEHLPSESITGPATSMVEGPVDSFHPAALDEDMPHSISAHA